MIEIKVKGRDEPVYFPDGTSEADIIAALKTLEPPKGMVEKTVDWFKGGQREDFIPTAFNAKLGLPADKSRKMVALLSTTASDDRLEMGIKKILPNATFDKDQYGNLVVTAPVFRDGKETGQFNRFYPNPAGLDATDAMIGAGAVATATGIGKALKTIGLPTSGLLGGATIGTTEAGLVEGASSALTGDQYKYSDLLYGAGGGALGAKAGELLQYVGKAFKKSPQSVMGSDGKLNPQIEAMLIKAGIDPDGVTKELAIAMKAQVDANIDPKEAARIAEASSLPVDIPLSKGQITGSKGNQLFEDSALSGGAGSLAEAVMTGQREKQRQAILANIPKIQEKIAGNNPVLASAGLGGEAAQDALVKLKTKASNKADDLYTAARETGNADLGLVRGDFGDALRGGIRKEFNLSTTPMTNSILDDIDDVLAQGGDIKQLFAIRTQFNNISDRVDKKAGQKARDLFDQKLLEYADEALISGDQNAVAAWNKAISNYSEFKSVWDSKGGILKSLTETGGRDGDMVLTVAPEAAANYILGVSNSKLMKPSNIARDLLTLKKRLPRANWNGIKQEAFLNLVGKAEKATPDGNTFSGMNFLKNWEAMKKNEKAIKALFEPDEMKLITQFANVTARATGSAVNSSNSAASVSGLIQKLAIVLASKGLTQTVLAAPIIKGGTEAISAGRAVKSMNFAGNKNPPNVTGSGVGGVVVPTDESRNLIEEKKRQAMGFFGRGY